MGNTTAAPPRPKPKYPEYDAAAIKAVPTGATIQYPSTYGPLTPTNTCPFQQIPKELQLHILTYVDEETISQSFRFVGKAQNVLAQDSWLWKNLAERDFPLSAKPSHIPLADENIDWQRAYFERACGWSEAEYVGCNTRENCRIKLQGKVYDITRFLDEHPGGDSILLEVGGTDATQQFEDIGHSEYATDALKQYLLTPTIFTKSTRTRLLLKKKEECAKKKA